MMPLMETRLFPIPCKSLKSTGLPRKSFAQSCAKLGMSCKESEVKGNNNKFMMTIYF